ncbi:MAG TPA: SOS response-associated peptidase [Gammaproteobacteria bacterium]|nr:SOS response-associated peptidase [Gammaproteobacteria bacterium]
MCGRFGLFVTPEVLEEYFSLTESAAALNLPARYNLTPGQAVAVVREHEGRRRVDALQWGLIPFWAKDASIGRKLVNARLDSVAVKPAFREAWTRRRCLIPASGFYEWSEPIAGRKRPHFIRPGAEPLLAIAGLWERWRSPSGEKLETCVIVTTDANAQLAQVHDRMPLLIPRDAHALWLDSHSSVDDVAKLVDRTPALDLHPVGFGVNDPRKDDETLVAPLDAATS